MKYLFLILVFIFLFVTITTAQTVSFKQHGIGDPGFLSDIVIPTDLDSDGDMDILSLRTHEHKVVWYEDQGNMDYVPHVISETVTLVKSAFTIDMDQDNDIDIIVASRGNSRVSWFDNDGTMNFTERIISNDAGWVNSVFALDFDGDNDIDIFSSNFLDDNISWYENDGNQNYTEHIVGQLEGPLSVYAADFDQDQDMDILTSSNLANGIYLFVNDGNNQYHSQNISGYMEDVEDIEVVDLDSDNDLDVIAVPRLNNIIHWYENRGNLAFTVQYIQDPSARTNLRSAYNTINSADIDLDGDIDLVYSSLGRERIQWYENLDISQFKRHNFELFGSFTEYISVADMDQDGDIDVLTNYPLYDDLWDRPIGSNPISWFENQLIESQLVPTPTHTYTPTNTPTLSNTPLPAPTLINDITQSGYRIGKYKEEVYGLGTLRAIKTDPQNRYYVTVGSAGAFIRDLTSHNILSHVDDIGEVISVSSSDDGNTISFGNTKGELTLWDFEKKQRNWTSSISEKAIFSMDFSDDSLQIAVGTAWATNPVKVYDVNTATLVRDITGTHSIMRTNLSLNYDQADSLYLGDDYVFYMDGFQYAKKHSFDQSILVWELNREFLTFDTHSVIFDVYPFNRNNEIIKLQSDETGWLYNTNYFTLNSEGEEVSFWVSQSSSHSDGDYAKVSRDQNRLLSLYYDTFQSSNFLTVINNDEIDLDTTFSTVRANFANSGEMYEYFGDHSLYSDIEITREPLSVYQSTYDYKIRTTNIQEDITEEYKTLSGLITDFDFSDDEKILLSYAYPRKGVDLLNLTSNEKTEIINFETRDGGGRLVNEVSIDQIIISSDKKSLYAIKGYDSIEKWNIADAVLVENVMQQGSSVTAIAHNPAFNMVATGNAQGGIIAQLFNGDSYQTSDHTHAIHSLTFSPNGKYLLSGSADDSAGLWDWFNGSFTPIQNETFWEITATGFSPDSLLFALGSSNQKVYLYNTESKELLYTFEGPQHYVSSVAFSKDGNYLVAGSEDSNIYAWNLQTYQIEYIFDSHTKAVTKVDFSPENKLVSSSLDGTLRVFDLSSVNPNVTSTPTFTITPLMNETPILFTPTMTSTPTMTQTPMPSQTPTSVKREVDEIILAQGQGGELLVQIRNFDAASGQAQNAILDSYRVLNQRMNDRIGGGIDRAVHLAVGDIDHDGSEDVVHTFGAVTSDSLVPNLVIPIKSSTKQVIGHSFNAFPAVGGPIAYSTGELFAAVGDYVEDGKNLIAVAQGVGSRNGLVRLFEYTGDPAPRSWRIVGQFQPLDDRPTQNNANGGVTLAVGDVDGDGRDELLAGQTSSDSSLTQFTVIDLDDPRNPVRHNFTAFPPGFRGNGGVELVVADLDGDGNNEIVASSLGNNLDGETKNVISVIRPLVLNQAIVGFTRSEASVVKLIGDDALNPLGALHIDAGEFDGDGSNGDEIIFSGGEGANRSFYRLVKIGYNPNAGRSGAVGAFTFLIGPPKNLDMLIESLWGGDGAYDGESVVKGIRYN